MRLKNFLTVLLLVLVVALPAVALAQLQPPGQVGNLPNLSGGGGPSDLIRNIINLILMFAGLVAVLFLIIGGYQYIVSGANEELAEQGKKTIQNAIIGLVIIILSYTIVIVVFRTFQGSP